MFDLRDKARPVNTLVIGCGHMNAILSGKGVFPHANNIALQAESSNVAARVVGIDNASKTLSSCGQDHYLFFLQSRLDVAWRAFSS